MPDVVDDEQPIGEVPLQPALAATMKIAVEDPDVMIDRCARIFRL